MVNAKTTNKGMITASSMAMALRDLLEEAVMSSLDDSSMTRSIAMRAPPMPMPIAVVKLTAVDELDTTPAIIGTSLIVKKKMNCSYIKVYGFVSILILTYFIKIN